MSRAFDVGARAGMEKVAAKGWEKWLHKVKVDRGKWRHFKTQDEALKHMSKNLADQAFPPKDWARKVVDKMKEPTTGELAGRLGMHAAIAGGGGLIGHHYGGEQRKRGERYSFGVPQALGVLFLPGGGGYQVGRYIAHKQKKKPE